MRGGARVKEALGFVTLLWNHPVLTFLLLLIFTPPFFPLVVYFSPLLMSTALCVVALVSVGSQMEKINAEGGPGQQLESHLARDRGVSTWAPRDHSSRNGDRHYGENTQRRDVYANIHVVPVPPSWTQDSNTTTTTTPAQESRDPPTPAGTESDEDWWDTWVKEYESRPGWGEEEDQQPFRTPATIPTPAGAPDPSTKEDAKREIRDENRPAVPAAPVVVVATPVSVSVVTNRQEAASRSLPPPPTTSTSRSPQEEVVVSVKVTDYIATLAPIRTGRESNDRIGKTPQEILAVAPTKAEDRVSNVQALQSIEKLLHMEIGGRNADVKNARMPSSQATESPGLDAKASPAVGKGIAVEATEKKIAGSAVVADSQDTIIAGETPLLRHLKTSRSESKHSRNSSAYSPLQLRSSRGLMSEKVLPPPQFSPRLLQSLQPLPPGKGVSPRPLPNSSTTPLGNPVEKIPQWVYDGIPKERAEQQAMKAETAEEKHVRAFEQAVKVLSYTRRRTHARRPAPIQVEGFKSTPSTPSVPPTERSSPSSPHRASVIAELPPTRTSENSAAAAERANGAGDPHGTDPTECASTILPTPRAFSPRILPSVNPNGASAAAAASPRISSSPAANPRGASASASPRISSANPHGASVAVSPHISSSPAANSHGSSASASPRISSANPHGASVAVSPRISSSPAATPHGASASASPRVSSANPHGASVAVSPRISSSPVANPHGALASASSPCISSAKPHGASVASSPRLPVVVASRASSPQSATIAGRASSPQAATSKAPSPRRTPRASSPSIGSSPWPASSPSPQKPPSIASSSAQKPAASRPSSPSMPHPRRRRSKHGTDKVALPIRIEGSTYYDTPAVEKEDSDAETDYVPIEKEVRFQEVNKELVEELEADANCEGEAALHWGRSLSRRSSNSRRRLEPRRVVTSQDTGMFCLKKSLSMRNGQTINFVDSSSTTDDERESVTPRASRRSMGRTIKPLVWRSRSVQAHEESD